MKMKIKQKWRSNKDEDETKMRIKQRWGWRSNKDEDQTKMRMKQRWGWRSNKDEDQIIEIKPDKLSSLFSHFLHQSHKLEIFHLFHYLWCLSTSSSPKHTTNYILSTNLSTNLQSFHTVTFRTIPLDDDLSEINDEDITLIEGWPRKIDLDRGHVLSTFHVQQTLYIVLICLNMMEARSMSTFLVSGPHWMSPWWLDPGPLTWYHFWSKIWTSLIRVLASRGTGPGPRPKSHLTVSLTWQQHLCIETNSVCDVISAFTLFILWRFVTEPKVKRITESSSWRFALKIRNRWIVRRDHWSVTDL